MPFNNQHKPLFKMLPNLETMVENLLHITIPDTLITKITANTNIYYKTQKKDKYDKEKDLETDSDIMLFLATY